MFNPTSPVKAGFTRLRGRPKQQKSPDRGTAELRQKRRRIRDILSDNHDRSIVSWLHITHHDGTISRDLFDLGTRYLRLRFRVLRSMQIHSLKLGCHTLTRHLSRNFTPGMEKRDEKAEEIWHQFLSVIPAEIIRTLDELLLENITYEISPQRIKVNKKRLKDALMHLSRYKDYL